MKRISKLLVFVLAAILFACSFVSAVGAADSEYEQAAKMFSALQMQVPDVDGVPALGIEDALFVLKAILNDTELENGDINNDGRITFLDVIRLLGMVVE